MMRPGKLCSRMMIKCDLHYVSLMHMLIISSAKLPQSDWLNGAQLTRLINFALSKRGKLILQTRFLFR